MSGFEKFIQERIYLQNVSPRTVEWYKQTFKWLEKYPLTEEGLKELVVGMRQAGLQAISCNSRIRCINAYLKWAGLPLHVPKLREDTKVMPTYTEGQLKSIIDFKPKTESERRLHTLVLTLIDAGLRIDEALSLKRASVNLDQMLLTVQGKGGKQRVVPFSFELRKVLWKYTSKQNANVDLLFSTRDGRKLQRRNMLRDFKALCRKLGFAPVKRSIHALRHTFAVNYLRHGGSVFHLQKALGHASLEMTRKYANLLTDDLQAMQHQVSLMNRLR
jgi:integrase/recombinase XerD